MDALFVTALLGLCVAAPVGVAARRRARDRCLADFHGFPVSLVLDDGEAVWGRLLVFSHGLELLYEQPRRDARGHSETSFVVMEDLLPRVRALRRYHDDLDEADQRRRLERLRRARDPGPRERLRRAVSAHAFEPLLERYVGRRVVLEEGAGGSRCARPGLLVDYTGDWIELLDHRLREEVAFSLAEPERLRRNRSVDVVVRRGAARGGSRSPLLELRLENQGDAPIRVVRLEIGGKSAAVDKLIPRGAFHELRCELPPAQRALVDAMPEEVSLRSGARAAAPAALPDVRIVLEAERAVDLCLPRRRTVLRHGGEVV